MERSGNLVSPTNFNLIPIPIPKQVVKAKSLKPSSEVPKNGASPSKQEPLMVKKGPRGPRRLVSVSPSHGRSKWDPKNSPDHIFTLRQLQLGDLVGEEQQDTKVSIYISVDEHASFGFSVDGKIITSFDSKCNKCLCTYRREINTGFQVWVLVSKRRYNRENQIPIISGEDPSVIYVKRGHEANLDSLIQETIRLETSVNVTCSESCENSEPKEFNIVPKHSASGDMRWAKLLELKKNFNSST